MDFKVTGTPDGITAIQMDIKVHGLSREILEQALEQARVGRAYILESMLEEMLHQELNYHHMRQDASR